MIIDRFPVIHYEYRLNQISHENHYPHRNHKDVLNVIFLYDCYVLKHRYDPHATNKCTIDLRNTESTVHKP